MKKFPIAVLSLALAGVASAQAFVSQSTTYTGPSEVIHLRSGNGNPGELDSEISVFPGVSGAAFGQALTPRNFAGARNGPGAPILDPDAFSLPLDVFGTGADWIAPDFASETGASTLGGLFAVSFERPDTVILGAALELTFSIDDFLGGGPNAGIFLNEQPISPTTVGFGGVGQVSYFRTDITSALRPGTNWLYFNFVNTGGPGAFAFDAKIVFNAPENDDCLDAIPAVLGSNPGTNIWATSSPLVGACPVQNELWYSFVPPVSGPMTIRLTSPGSSALSPAIAIYAGSCGAFQLGACDTSGGAVATVTGNATAGSPLYIAVGGATQARGEFVLRITVDPTGALVYGPTGHEYVLSPNIMSWLQARTWAQSQGGYLVCPNDQAENDWIRDNVSNGDRLWMGLTDEVSEGVWVFESGEPYGSFTNWSPGEPNDSAVCGGEDYTEMFGDGRWNDNSDDACGGLGYRAIAEVPTTGKASATDLGGACGQDFVPTLYSEPHVLGTTVDMAVIGAAPFATGTIFRSGVPLAPTPALGCTIHFDLLGGGIFGAFVTNAFGSYPFQVPVPNIPGLIGMEEIWQAQIDVPAGQLSYTNGMSIIYGN